MLNIEIIRKVSIAPIAEDWLQEVVRNELLKQLPAGVVINRIDFVRKLNPQRIEVEVDAQFEDSKPAVETISSYGSATGVKAEPCETVVIEPEEEEPVANTLKDIFGS